MDSNQLKSAIMKNEPYATTMSTILNPNIVMDVFEDEKRYQACAKSIYNSIYEGEIIKIDNSIDDIIYDTNPLEEDIELPYDKFFINKYFIHDKLLISGVAFEKTEMGLSIIIPVFGIGEDNCGAFDCSISLSRNNKLITDFNKIDVFNEKMEELEDDIKEDSNKFIKDSMKYIANIINIITMKNDDIKFVKINSSNKKNKTSFGEFNPNVRPITHIRIGGETKKYINQYNKAKKSKKFKKSMIVRGHWRFYQSDRYKNMKGKKQWIAPYIKGTGKELMHKFVIIDK